MGRLITYITLLFLLAGCGASDTPFDLSDFQQQDYTPQYATGFEIRHNSDSSASLIVVRNPWQGANDVEQMLLIDPEKRFNNLPKKIKHIDHPARRIVCMSSSYVAMLSELGHEENIVGVSGIDFISNQYICNNRDKIGDVGYDNNINYELLISLQPDLVLLYGITGANSMETRLEELGIPYIYLGEYVESSPLGKAEWLVVIGEMIGCPEVARNRFSEIATCYEQLSERTRKTNSTPRVMLNTPYRDSWFIPSQQSYMVQLINDAGAKCYTCSADGNTSQPIDMELAYVWAAEADFWLNVGPYNTIAELIRQNPKFADIKTVSKRQVYNNNARQTPRGGSDFWESGVVRPDRILQDLITIFHPNLSTETSHATEGKNNLYYYQQLK